MKPLEARSLASSLWSDTSASASPQVESGVMRHVQAPQGMSLFAPLHHEANYRYPLVVWLHGPQDDESQLKRIMPLLSLRNYVGVAPRGAVSAMNDDRPAYTWGQAEEDLSQAEDAVERAIHWAGQRFRLHPRRTFIAGFDVGGTMAFRVALRRPDRFAGVLTLGGPFPTQGRPLATFTTARRLPVFIACCRESQHYPTETVCDNLRLLHSVGMPITLRQYPGDQQLSPQILADMNHWIMDEISQQTAAE